MPQNASGRLKTRLLPEPMLSDGLRTALNDNSCEMGGIFCYTQRQVYLLMTILGVFFIILSSPPRHHLRFLHHRHRQISEMHARRV